MTQIKGGCLCGKVRFSADALPGVVMVNAGALDDRSWVKPQSEVYCDSAQPWVRLEGELQRFGKMPA